MNLIKYIFFVLLFFTSTILSAQFVSEFNYLASLSAPSVGTYSVDGIFTNVENAGDPDYTASSILTDGTHYFIDREGVIFQIVAKPNLSPLKLELDNINGQVIAPTTGIGQLTTMDRLNKKLYRSSGVGTGLSAKIQRINVPLGASLSVQNLSDTTSVNTEYPNDEGIVIYVDALDEHWTNTPDWVKLVEPSVGGTTPGIGAVIAQDQDAQEGFIYDLTSLSFTDDNVDSKYWVIQEDGTGDFSISSPQLPNQTLYNFPLNADGSDDANDVIRRSDLAGIGSGSTAASFVRSVTEPIDSTTVWAKPISVLPLEKIHVYNDSGYVHVGWLNTLTRATSVNAPKFLFVTGQSNGRDGHPARVDGDLTTDPRVCVWDYEDGGSIWQLADVGLTNGLGFQTAKQIAKNEDRLVFYVVVAETGRPISAWQGVGSMITSLKSTVDSSGVESFDYGIMAQSEGNTVTDSLVYLVAAKEVVDTLRTQPWFGESRPLLWLMPGTWDGACGPGQAELIRNFAIDEDPWLTNINTDSITPAPLDNCHFSGPGTDTLGLRAYTALKGLPYDLDRNSKYLTAASNGSIDYYSGLDDAFAFNFTPTASRIVTEGAVATTKTLNINNSSLITGTIWDAINNGSGVMTLNSISASFVNISGSTVATLDVAATNSSRLIYNATEDLWYETRTANVTGGGGITDGDKGDITVASGVWTIDNNAVTTAKINDAAVTTDKIANNTILAIDLAANSVTSAAIASSGVVAGTYNNANVTFNEDGIATFAEDGIAAVTSIHRIPTGNTITYNFTPTADRIFLQSEVTGSQTANINEANLTNGAYLDATNIGTGTLTLNGIQGDFVSSLGDTTATITFSQSSARYVFDTDVNLWYEIGAASTGGGGSEATTVADTDDIDLTLTGTQITATTIIDPVAGNTLEKTVAGLKVVPADDSETNELPELFTGGTTPASPKIGDLWDDGIDKLIYNGVSWDVYDGAGGTVPDNWRNITGGTVSTDLADNIYRIGKVTIGSNNPSYNQAILNTFGNNINSQAARFFNNFAGSSSVSLINFNGGSTSTAHFSAETAGNSATFGVAGTGFTGIYLPGEAYLNASKGMKFHANNGDIRWTFTGSHTVGMRLSTDRRLIIGSSGTPTYRMEIAGTDAAVLFVPHDVTLTGTEGLFYADDSENTFKGHNGVESFRFMQQSEVIPTNGQIGVWNATTGLYDPTTVPLTTPDLDAVLFQGSTANNRPITNLNRLSFADRNSNSFVWEIAEDGTSGDFTISTTENTTSYDFPRGTAVDPNDVVRVSDMPIVSGTTGRLAQFDASNELIDAPLESTGGLLRQTQVTALELASGTTGERPLATTAGRIRRNTTTNKTEISNGTDYDNIATEDYVNSRVETFAGYTTTGGTTITPTKNIFIRASVGSGNTHTLTIDDAAIFDGQYMDVINIDSGDLVLARSAGNYITGTGSVATITITSGSARFVFFGSSWYRIH